MSQKDNNELGVLPFAERMRAGYETAYILFDGPPGPEGGRFVEVENEAGQSIKAGEWIQRGDLWALKVRLLLSGSQ